MSSPLAPPSPEVTALLDEGFEVALERHRTSDYVFVKRADDYAVSYGKGVQGLLRTADKEAPHILDIGAGSGIFPAMALVMRPKATATAMTAAQDVRNQFTGDRLSWVYGDVARPDTLRPQNTPASESVDLAVSNLTFMHLPDPLRALATVLPMLSKGGRLEVDSLSLPFSTHATESELENCWSALQDLGLRGDPAHSGVTVKDESTGAVLGNSIVVLNASYTKEDDGLYDLLGQFDTNVESGWKVKYSFAG